VVTPGLATPEIQKLITDELPSDMRGKTVLDIGASDGFYSFYAEECGAKEVNAVDNYIFGEGQPKGGVERYKHYSSRGFILDKELKKSRVALHDTDLYELGGMIPSDYTFMFSVHHHLDDPILGFDIVCSLTKEKLFLEGDALLMSLPLMYFDYGDDVTKCWRMSLEFLQVMMAIRGFTNMKKHYQHFKAELQIKDLGLINNNPVLVNFPMGNVFLEFTRGQ